MAVKVQENLLHCARAGVQLEGGDHVNGGVWNIRLQQAGAAGGLVRQVEGGVVGSVGGVMGNFVCLCCKKKSCCWQVPALQDATCRCLVPCAVRACSGAVHWLKSASVQLQ